MKKMTIRVDDYIYDRVNLLAKESKISSNKIVANILKNNLLKNNDTHYSKEINKKLDYLIRNSEDIRKRQLAHFKVSKQHFANRGFLSNADIREDRCLNESNLLLFDDSLDITIFNPIEMYYIINEIKEYFNIKYK